MYCLHAVLRYEQGDFHGSRADTNHQDDEASGVESIRQTWQPFEQIPSWGH